MSRQAVIALDVGGTTIDRACVSIDCELIGGVRESGSPAAGTRDEIVHELVRVIDAARAGAGSAEVIACGIAMPAPFDYPAGVSHMAHKFLAIRDLPLGTLLATKAGLPVYFLNDADAFGLGVGWRQLPDLKRFVALTIGTGLGSGFIEDGRAVTSGNQVPPDGEVWNLPYGGGILEDHVSARALTTAYATRPVGTGLPGPGVPGRGKTAREVSVLAAEGDETAVAAFRAMGEALGRGLVPVLERFEPEAVVIGGKVGQSLGLFAPAMRHALARAGLPNLPVIPAAPGNMAIWGAARHALTAGLSAAASPALPTCRGGVPLIRPISQRQDTGGGSACSARPGWT
jgi:glucokinase